MEEMKELLVLGNFVGRLLESFPPEIRSKALKDIEDVEQYYCMSVHQFSSMRPILAHQLRRIEHCGRVLKPNRDPRLKGRKTIENYGGIIQSYLSSIPKELRADLLKDICSIVYYYGSSIENYDKSNPCKDLLNILYIFESLI